MKREDSCIPRSRLPVTALPFECFLEDQFLGSQWSIILGYRRLSVKSFGRLCQEKGKGEDNRLEPAAAMIDHQDYFLIIFFLMLPQASFLFPSVTKKLKRMTEGQERKSVAVGKEKTSLLTASKLIFAFGFLSSRPGEAVCLFFLPFPFFSYPYPCLAFGHRLRLGQGG